MNRYAPIALSLALIFVAHPALASTSTLYTNSTSVGVGTTTPLNALEVYDGVIEGAQLAIGTTSTDGLLLANTTAATSSVQQYSPRVHFSGQGWKTNSTASSQSVDMIEEVQPVSGASAPTGNLVWSNSINGGSYSALMALTSGGYLGIGTTSPTNILSLAGQSAQEIWMEREYTASTAGNNLTLSAGGATSGGSNLLGGNLILSSGITTGTGTSSVQFQAYPAAASSGSGDNSAITAATLSASGSASSGQGTLATTIQSTGGSGTDKNGGALTLASGVSTGTGSSNINFNVYGAAGSSSSTVNSPTTAMTILGNGNVGIGTPSAGAPLQIAGTSDPALQVDHNGTSGNPSLWLQQDGTTEAYVWWDRQNSRLNFGTPTTNPIMSLTNNGNVGIGIANPSYPLVISTTVGYGEEISINTNSGQTALELSNNSSGSSAAIGINLGNDRSSYAGIIQLNSHETTGGCGADCLAVNAAYGPLALYAGSGEQVQVPANELFVGSNGLVVGYGGNTAPTNGAIIQGNVGIGTTSPLQILDVRGLIAGNGHVSNGTTFTIASGCGTPGSLTGGATTGSFTAGQAACAPVITLPTAPNGWWCNAIDVTHPADVFTVTAKSTTSCTVSATVTTGDTIVFHAEAY